MTLLGRLSGYFKSESAFPRLRSDEYHDSFPSAEATLAQSQGVIPIDLHSDISGDRIHILSLV